MRMKKMLMLFLLTASLGFSANYKVEVKPNVKIQKSEIEKNNIRLNVELEKIIGKERYKEIEDKIKFIE